MPHMATCAGKAAVLGMTRQLALEGAPAIRANTISPGQVVTPATDPAPTFRWMADALLRSSVRAVSQIATVSSY